VADPEFTELWERLRRETYPVVAMVPPHGSTTAGISGFLLDAVTTSMVFGANRVTFGSSALPQMNGRGWEEAVASINLAHMALWARRMLEVFQAGAIVL
jgi:hypothetical protein